MRTYISILSILFVVLIVPASASYTYTVGPGDKTSLSLDDYESLLMTGGELYHLNLFDWSSARIENTAPLIREGYGGIWRMSHGDYANLEILGGEIHQLELFGYARTVISGGRIDELKNHQNVGTKWLEGSDPPVWVADPHIEIICRDKLYNPSTKKLTGTWEDLSTFNIQLVNVAGYSPAIDNIFFTIIPEPMSLLLFAAGAALIRKREMS